MTAITLSRALRKKASYMTPSAMPAARKRRVDIDILRAVAVLSVIFFHFEVPGFSGGFLGVDIFFVISGYLITLHINEGLTRGDFKFANFYLRRIRRLFPAIFITLVLTSVAALLILPKSLLTDFSQSQLAASTYISNIYFWSVADYFDTESIVKPLLHTWSLSVEEQFYMVWPLLIFLIFGQNQLRFIMAFIVISLVAAELTFSHSPSTVFYYFPFRIFEFAIGAMVGQLPPRQLKKLATNGLLLVAGFCVLGSIYLTTEESRNPGLLSLPLCMGVAAIIGLCHPWMNTDNYLTKVLVRVGLVSYSAYLVHWPLLVFYKIYKPGPLSIEATAALIAVTFLLAEILFNCVERPMSKVSIVEHKLKLFLFVPLVFIFALAFKLGEEKLFRAINSQIFGEQSILDGISDSQDMWKERNPTVRVGTCWLMPADNFSVFDVEECLRRVEGKKNYLILGDSIAADYYSVFTQAYPQYNFLQATSGNCHPVISSANSDNCKYLIDYILNEFLPNIPVDGVILVASWRGIEELESIPSITQILSQNVDNIFVAGPPIRFRDNVPDLIFKANSSDRKTIIDFVYANRHPGDYINALVEGKTVAPAKFLDLHAIMCSEGCRLFTDQGKLIFVDFAHLSKDGATYMGKVFREKYPELLD